MIAENPRQAPDGFRTSGSLALEMLMTSQPTRGLAPSERATVIQRAASLERAASELSDRQEAADLQRAATRFVASRRTPRR
ncbi:hypothetical protein ROS62_08310 [Streptomyces sp. DSM 41972]|uniref:ANTAR domain-containing protein n=1 Tax=Streptomyces althioticus subsp. attaecolombicae TaxID=3075534 RepID=A0ABU3HW54_9ACTN|nr:hypothetical protein [Streptomyces sp. DSM 41972]SCD67573.1 hypothetical protein GA0115238_120076 [Streptomyces sp. di50b]SCD75691.1 hypothetical protein GA0115245_112575 [Streptomyces sp. di188]